MKISIFGANGATGRILVDEALTRGHGVNAVTRHPSQFPLKHERLHIVRADVTDGSSLDEAISGCDAVASVLGATYSRKPINVYSQGTRAIVAAMDEARCKRIAVVSSGLTYPPGPGYGFLFDKIIHPLLHNIIGRTLYADMRAMEEYLRGQPDIDSPRWRSPARRRNSSDLSYDVVDDTHPRRAARMPEQRYATKSPAPSPVRATRN